MYSYCDTCRAHEHVKSPCISGGVQIGGQSDIMIIGDVPTYHEDAKNSVFVGHVSSWFAEEAYKLGLDVSSVYVTKALKCNGAGDFSESFAQCKHILLEEIAHVKPKYILTLGATPLRMLKNKTASIMKQRGGMFLFDGIPVVPTLNPSLVLSQPVYLANFLSDIAYFANMSNGAFADDSDFAWTLIKTQDDFKTMMKDLRASKYVAYDIETEGLGVTDIGGLHMVGIASDTHNYIVPFNRYIPKEVSISIVNRIFALGKETIAHNSKFDNLWLDYLGMTPYTTFDTMLASYTIDVNAQHGLKHLARVKCGAKDYGLSKEVFKRVLTEAEFLEMAEYCAKDVYYTRKVWLVLREELLADMRLARIFKYIIMPGERVLQQIRKTGAHVSEKALESVTELYVKELALLDDELSGMLPEKYAGINWGSPKQLADLLFNELEMTPPSYTDSGQPSTGKASLLRLVDKHPIPKVLLNRRTYDKALSSFLLPWKEYRARTGRLHTTYNIGRTGTGRLSAEDPNLQQVSRDKRIRNLISAKPGCDLIEADYSQIELRAASIVANATSMKEAYRRGEDIHTKTAISVSGKRPENITKADRTGAKAVNFGYLYGMWWKSFKAYAFDTYGVIVTDDEAKHSRTAYFETYPELVEWHERQVKEVRATGCVRSPLGRLRNLPNINSTDSDLRGSAERQAINTPVQSFASDMTMVALILIHELGEMGRFKGHMWVVGQVHDAILVEVEKAYSIEVGHFIKHVMEIDMLEYLKRNFKVTIDVPIVADVTIGPSWGDGESLETLAKA